MIKETVLSRTLRLVFAGGLAVAVPYTAFAQEVQKVEVLGSSIRRSITSETTLPVQTFSQKDIQKTGVSSVTDFIQQLPAMQGFTAATDSVGGGGGGITTASIHGVGEQYTLVLLNGRRIAPANSGSTIDLNSIPLSAVERIEVLTDGASAVYGADAIAGVVNFILKKGASPFEITLKTSKPQKTGGESWNLGLSKGWGDLEADGFSAMVSYAHDENKQLKAADRDFAKTGIINFQHGGKTLRFFNGSSRGIPPNATVTFNSTPVPKNLNPFALANGGCAARNVDAFGDGQCYFDYASTVEIYPEQKRDAFFANGAIKLGKTGFTAKGTFSYTDAHINARIAPYPADFRITKASPLYAPYIKPYLTAEQDADVKSVLVKYRLFEMGGRSYDYGTKATHWVGEVAGEAMGWDLKAGLVFSENKQTNDYTGGFPLDAEFTTLINSGKLDVFKYKLGEMPADQKALLLGTGFKGNYSTQTVRMTAADFAASRELFALGGGSAALAFGADYRHTKYGTDYAKVAEDALILFEDPKVDDGFKRSNWGAFAEMNLPFTKQLEASASLRYDSIGATENTVEKKTYGSTQSKSTYKVSMKFTPSKQFYARAAYGTGFKVGTMQQIAGTREDWGVSGGTYACPITAENGLGSHPLASFCPVIGKEADGRNKYAKAQVEAFRGGNANLAPEKSKQWSIGVGFQPVDWMTAKLDLWSVEIEDAIQAVDEAEYFANPAKHISLFTTKTKPGGETYLAYLLAPANLASAQYQGLDYEFSASGKVFDGRLVGTFQGTHLLKSRYRSSNDADWSTSLDQYGPDSAVQFRNIFKFNLTWDNAAWTHSATVNYKNGYKDKEHKKANGAVTEQPSGTPVDIRLDVPDYTTLDWQTVYRWNKNLTLTGGIINVFDKEPPLSLRNTGSHQLGYDPRYASSLGRTFYIQGSYKF
ncbi:TonB-dependent receptor [Massilia sp. W12]|uniref:TonB-dependent receptor n=1 Tax=Massilia sp. W12 TaxID=3126507 RepID=UPI0030D0DA95